MKKLSLKKISAIVLVLLLGLAAGDIALREESDVLGLVEKVKSKVEVLLDETEE